VLYFAVSPAHGAFPYSFHQGFLKVLCPLAIDFVREGQTLLPANPDKFV
jgi:hypothetical protein